MKPHSSDPQADVDTGKSINVAVYSDEALAAIAVVQEAMDRWRRQNDPADPHGLTMAEVVVLALSAHGRLK